jgi:D-glycero-D-manno-heptose 1,7-bisphosphate phosphatase
MQEWYSASIDPFRRNALRQISTIFFDRDGVINDIVMRGPTVGSPRAVAEFVIRPDFVEFHRQLSRYNLNLFVVSNQPDVSRQVLSESVLSTMTEMLSGFNFREVVYCRHDDSHECSCRKPKPGMIVDLLAKYGLDPKEALLVGDSHKDILAGRAAELCTVMLRRAYNLEDVCAPDFVVNDIRELFEIPDIKFRPF